MLDKNPALSPGPSALKRRLEQTVSRTALGTSCAADPPSHEHQHQPYPVAYSIAQFAAAFGLSRSHVYNLFQRGEGPKTFTAGRRRLITGSSVVAWVRRNEILASEQSISGAKP
jgi:excisionase family DNA binding protein